MARETSAAFKAAAFASRTDEAFIGLITIDHPMLEVPVRVAMNPVDIVSNLGGAEDFTFIGGIPVIIELPSDEDDSPPVASIQIDNTSPEIVVGLRSIRSWPTVTIVAVLASQPNVVDLRLPRFRLVNARYDLTITGALEAKSLVSEPYPGGQYSPARAPAVTS